MMEPMPDGVDGCPGALWAAADRRAVPAVGGQAVMGRLSGPWEANGRAELLDCYGDIIAVAGAPESAPTARDQATARAIALLPSALATLADLRGRTGDPAMEARIGRLLAHAMAAPGALPVNMEESL